MSYIETDWKSDFSDSSGHCLSTRTNAKRHCKRLIQLNLPETVDFDCDPGIITIATTKSVNGIILFDKNCGSPETVIIRAQDDTVSDMIPGRRLTASHPSCSCALPAKRSALCSPPKRSAAGAFEMLVRLRHCNSQTSWSICNISMQIQAPTESKLIRR